MSPFSPNIFLSQCHRNKLNVYHWISECCHIHTASLRHRAVQIVSIRLWWMLLFWREKVYRLRRPAWICTNKVHTTSNGCFVIILKTQIMEMVNDRFKFLSILPNSFWGNWHRLHQCRPEQLYWMFVILITVFTCLVRCNKLTKIITLNVWCWKGALFMDESLFSLFRAVCGIEWVSSLQKFTLCGSSGPWWWQGFGIGRHMI